MLTDVGSEIAELEKEELTPKEKAERKEKILQSYATQSDRVHTINQLLKAYTLFEKDALVFKHLQSNKLTLLKKNEPVFSVQFEGFPYLGIWTKPNAPFLCIEPWCGLADNVNHNGNIFEKEGINLLHPQEIFSRTIKITL
jgi:galactose mutarotase-like enzyme